MGAFLSLLWDRVFGAEELKVCIIGLDNAGKTTLLYQMHLGEVVATQPTIGSNVELVEHKNVKLQAWDLGGQEQLRTTWKAYFLGANAVILVVDSTDRARIKICKQELHRALEVDSLKDAYVLVFANKQDLKDAMTPAEISIALDLVNIKRQSWHIQGCCALTGDGVEAGLDWIISQLKPSKT